MVLLQSPDCTDLIFSKELRLYNAMRVLKVVVSNKALRDYFNDGLYKRQPPHRVE